MQHRLMYNHSTGTSHNRRLTDDQHSDSDDVTEAAYLVEWGSGVPESDGDLLLLRGDARGHLGPAHYHRGCGL